MIESLYYTVDLLGVALLLAMIVMLVIKGIKKTEHKVLGLAFLALSVMVLMDLFAADNYFSYSLIGIIELSFGPLLIYYIQTVSKEDPPMNWWIYVIVPFLTLCFAISSLFIDEANNEDFLSSFSLVLEFISLIAVIGYAMLAVVYFQRTRLANPSMEPRIVRWISILIFCFFGQIFIAFIYLFIYTVSDGSEWLWLTDSLISFALNLVLFVKAIQYRIIVTERREVMAEDESDQRWKELFEEIDQRVSTGKLYLQSELRINDLAIEMSTNSKYISKAINLGAGESVSNYLNTLRLIEFKRLVDDQSNSHINIYALAEECGFSSKSSFNRFFKMREGMTPSEYRNR